MPYQDIVKIKDFIVNSKYSKFFKPPAKQNVVWRGMSVSESWIKRALKLTAKQKLPSVGSETSKFVYKPRKGYSSSWSLDRTVADNFSKKGDGEYEVVIHASPEDNPASFLDLASGFYNLKRIEGFKGEREVLGLGWIRSFKIEWRWRK
jgi:hypothetical protein